MRPKLRRRRFGSVRVKCGTKHINVEFNSRRRKAQQNPKLEKFLSLGMSEFVILVFFFVFALLSVLMRLGEDLG